LRWRLTFANPLILSIHREDRIEIEDFETEAHQVVQDMALTIVEKVRVVDAS
jgi:hypothetical protein